MVWSKLLAKDYFMNRKLLWWYGIGVVAYAGYMSVRISSPWVFFFFCGFLCSFIPLTLYTREGRFKGNVLNRSLPVSVAQLIRSRYTNSMILTLVFLTGSLAISQVLPASIIPASSVFQAGTIVHLLFLCVIVVSSFIPFIVGFGFIGVIYFMVLTQVAGILMLVLTPQVKGVRSGMSGLIAAVKSFFANLQESLPYGLYLLVLLAVSSLLLYLSYLLAVVLYRRKEY